MPDPTDDQLRESARHRGLKLLKSRRRKPGGDFGRYGLADAAGRPVFGVSEDGLTASATDIADHLRKGDTATWASSVDTTPKRARPTPKPKSQGPGDPIDPSQPTESEDVLPRRREPRAKQRTVRDAAPPPPQKPDRPAPKPRPAPPPPPPKPDLTIRPATRADAAALAALVPDTPAPVLAERLAAAAALGEPVLVAEQAGVIGCLAWHVLPTLHHGAIARITFLAVVHDRRRRGIGTRLLDHLAALAAARDLSLVEAIGDIAVRNANGFFRRTGFDQTGYRFARASNLQKDRS